MATARKKTARKTRKSRATASPSSGMQRQVGNTAVKARTGLDWDGWFNWLDGQNARALDHKAIVALLSIKKNLEPWWRQMVTVAYEQARGLRAPQQKTGQRDPCHFLLDDKRKTRRQRGFHHRPIEVAAMIGDHHAGTRGQMVQSDHTQAHAGRRKHHARHGTGQRTASLQSGHQQHPQQRDNAENCDGKPRVNSPQTIG